MNEKEKTEEEKEEEKKKEKEEKEKKEKEEERKETTTTTTTASASASASTSPTKTKHEQLINHFGDIDKLPEATIVLNKPISQSAFQHQYKFIKNLGRVHDEGGTVDLYQVRHNHPHHLPAGKLVAIKSIKHSFLFKNANAQGQSQNMALTEREMQILSSLKHPHCNKILDIFLFLGANSVPDVYIVLEYATGGDLLRKVHPWDANNKCFLAPKPLEENVARLYLQQVAEALFYLHCCKNICSRDLKAENCLLTERVNPLSGKKELSVQVADFGTSKSISTHGQLVTVIGTHFMIAPEVLLDGKNNKPYTFACDLFAFGLLAMHLLTGKFAFGRADKLGGDPNVTEEDVRKNIIGHKFLHDPDVELESFSQELRKFVKSLLSFDPQERPKIEECFGVSRDKRKNNNSNAANASAVSQEREEEQRDQREEEERKEKKEEEEKEEEEKEEEDDKFGASWLMENYVASQEHAHFWRLVFGLKEDEDELPFHDEGTELKKKNKKKKNRRKEGEDNNQEEGEDDEEHDDDEKQ